MGFDLGYIRVAGLHRECKPAILFDPPNFRPRTMTHTLHTNTLKARHKSTYILRIALLKPPSVKIFPTIICALALTEMVAY